MWKRKSSKDAVLILGVFLELLLKRPTICASDWPILDDFLPLYRVRVAHLMGQVFPESRKPSKQAALKRSIKRP